MRPKQNRRSNEGRGGKAVKGQAPDEACKGNEGKSKMGREGKEETLQEREMRLETGAGSAMTSCNIFLG